LIYEEEISIVAYRFSPEGSLKDLIYDAKPAGKYARKYPQGARGTPVRESNMALWGKQMLEAMLYLKACGVPYTHLHTGNVILRSDVARLVIFISRSL